MTEGFYNGEYTYYNKNITLGLDIYKSIYYFCL